LGFLGLIEAANIRLCYLLKKTSKTKKREKRNENKETKKKGRKGVDFVLNEIWAGLQAIFERKKRKGVEFVCHIKFSSSNLF